MPEYVRALIVVLVLAWFGFTLAKVAVVPTLMRHEDFSRRRTLWFFLTAAAFLSMDVWIFFGLAALLLLKFSFHERNQIALYLSVIFVVPMIPAVVPGFGIVNYLFPLTFPRLLSLLILLPAYIALRKSSKDGHESFSVADWLVLGYLTLGPVLQLRTDTFTNTARYAFSAYIDAFLPYFVVSRSLRTIPLMRDAMSALLIAIIALIPIAFFEYAKGWMLYSSLSEALNTWWDLGGYLLRGDILRAAATTGQPIVLGYVLAVGIGLFLFLGGAIQSRAIYWGTFGALLIGIIAPVSRGPWIGAAVIVLVFVMLGPNPVKQLVRIAVLSAILVLIVAASPIGDKVLNYLPFVGQIDANNVTFRQQLLENGVKVVLQNPLFGSFDYLYTPEMQEMKQGFDGGIIDVTNTFLGIALTYGIAGLLLFLSAFAWLTMRIVRICGEVPDKNSDLKLLGRSLVATMIGILIIIFTVSSITFVPIVYWIVLGFSSAYVRLADHPVSVSGGKPILHSA